MASYKNLAIFLSGVAVGAISVWFVMTKKSYEAEDAAELERSTVKEEENKDETTGVDKASVKTNRVEYFNIASKYSLDALDTEDEEEPDPGPPPEDSIAEKPYPITPEDFANGNRNYEKVTLIYYDGDKVVTDEFGDLIEEPLGDFLGTDILDHVGEYEDDVAYIRNEAQSTDYEFCVEHKFYLDDRIDSELR